MVFNFLRRLYRRFFKKERTQPDLRSEFLNTSFEGGTLVEYQEGFGYDVEYDRGKVEEVRIREGEIHISTDTQAKFGIANQRNMLVLEKRKGVFYFQSAIPMMGWMYAIAPPGVDIPKRPSLEEISRENDKR